MTAVVTEDRTSPVPVTIVAHDIGGIGGMERQLEQLVLRVAELGHEVLVIARGCRLPPHPRIVQMRVPGPARPFAVAYPWFFTAGSLLVKRRRRGIVHVTGAIVGNRADVATVHLCHRALSRRGSIRRSRRRSPAYIVNAVLARWLSLAGERWCYRPRRLATIVSVSSGVGEEIARWFPALAGHATTIPNAVDHDAFKPAEADERARIRNELTILPERLVALFVGSEWERKGLSAAIEAVARRPEWDLVVAGSGDQARYEELARSHGAADRVRFAGRISDTIPLYQAADAFLLPSAYEAFSLAMLEAASCGLPLLATQVSGAEDLLEDGINGWFVRRDGDDIALRLNTLADDAARRRAMGAAARTASARYSWDEVARAYSDLYQRLGSSAARAAPEPVGAST